MREPDPKLLTKGEYKVRLWKYKKYKAEVEATQIARARVYVKHCEACNTPMYNISRVRRFCLDRDCNIADRRKRKQGIEDQ